MFTNLTNLQPCPALASLRGANQQMARDRAHSCPDRIDIGSDYGSWCLDIPRFPQGFSNAAPQLRPITLLCHFLGQRRDAVGRLTIGLIHPVLQESLPGWL